MAKPTLWVTPPDRIPKWKKLWGTPKPLDQASTDAAFEEFTEAVVPRHMHKLFLKTFGTTKAKYGNRFFRDEAQFVSWQTRLSHAGVGENVNVEATVIYGSADRLEGHVLKGDSRRTLKDLVIDDWFGCCAIVRAPTATVYVFIEHKATGCIVRLVQTESEESEAEPEP